MYDVVIQFDFSVLSKCKSSLSFLIDFFTFFPSWVGDPVLDEAAEASAELLSEGLRQIFFRDTLNKDKYNILNPFQIFRSDCLDVLEVVKFIV